MKGIAIRVIRQMRGDKRTLAIDPVRAGDDVYADLTFLLGDTGYIPTIAAGGKRGAPGDRDGA